MTLYLPQLDPAFPEQFPPLNLARTSPDGLLAFGGDLSCARLLAAYRQAIFPWFDVNSPYLWWSPSQRAVFIPEQFHVSRSLKKFQRKQNYTVTINHCFPQIIRHCALHRGAEQVWITEDMRAAYTDLHHKNHAHSVEVWQDGELIGGMYGVTVGALFCGESMFSLKPNASKVALWYFLHHFAKNGGKLFECQILTSHLASLGASELTRQEYWQCVQILQKEPLSRAIFAPQIITLT